MTTTLNIFAILAAFGALCILAALSLVIVIIREIAKLLGILRAIQTEVRSTAQAIAPHIRFEGETDQSEVKIQEDWDEKNELRG